MRHRIYITQDSGVVSFFGIKRLLRKAIRACLKAEGIKTSCEVSVLITDDKGIQRLNSEFRGKDMPTDVLSFPANTITAGSFNPDGMERGACAHCALLGDMAISLERARAQGREFGHGAKREIQYLAVHSALHLLGYDHEDEGMEKKRMRDREKEIMKTLGIDDGG